MTTTRTRLVAGAVLGCAAVTLPLAPNAGAAVTSQKLVAHAYGSNAVIGKVVVGTQGTVLTLATHVDLAPSTKYFVLGGKLNADCTAAAKPDSVKLIGSITTGSSGKGGLQTTHPNFPAGTYSGFDILVMQKGVESNTVVGGVGRCFGTPFSFTLG